eukprot:CAMPEP_0174875014 /NCGR_PEP_ID=MMETSP1114-20130205/77645_1 /TAXON_ID=312471 /ORGANISM="Neobodo designis, Strain CCAP 1951/1" /LENGTH=126 /DNA_ID=CAMNT_0016110361 /DNA_START=29 /DNA_END=409 /DNA_ORIENTATION=+
MAGSASEGAEPLRLLFAETSPGESLSLAVVVKTAERRQDRRAARRQRKLDARTKAPASEANERSGVARRRAIARVERPAQPQHDEERLNHLVDLFRERTGLAAPMPLEAQRPRLADPVFQARVELA